MLTGPKRAAIERDAHLFDEFRDRIKPLGMAWSENHGCLWMADAKILECFKQWRFLVFNGAAAHEDRSGAFCCERATKALHNRRGRRNVPIELQISRDPYACRISSDGLQPSAVLLGLREKEIDLGEHASEGPAEAAIARPGAIGDARIDDGNACAAVVRQAEKVRPEFSFGQYDQFGFQSLQKRTDSGSEVHGEVEDVFFAKTLTSLILAGVGGGRDEDPVLRKSATQLRDQADDGQDFSEGNGVNPDNPDAVERAQPRWNFPHPFGKSAPVLAVAQRLIKPIWRSDQYGQGKGETINKIDQVESF